MLDEYSVGVNRALEKEKEEKLKNNLKTTLNRKEGLKHLFHHYIKCKDEFFQARNRLIATMTWEELLEANLRHEAMNKYSIDNRVTLLEARRFIENYKK